MASAETKAALKAARKTLVAGEFAEALRHAKEVLQEDDNNYDALLFSGKAHFGLGEYQLSQRAYERAVEVEPRGLQAWKGLAELHWAADDAEKSGEALEHLLLLTEGAVGEGEASRRSGYRWRLADVYLRRGRFVDSIAQLRVLLDASEPGAQPLTPHERLEALCMLANAQIEEERYELEKQVEHKLLKYSTTNLEELAATGSTPHEAVKKAQRLARVSTFSPAMPISELRVRLHAKLVESEQGQALTDTLRCVMAATSPSQRYKQLYEEHLSRTLVLVLAAPARSMEREERRRAAIEDCQHMVSRDAAKDGGGCCTPLPYEAAIWLWEEEEELKGGSHIVGGQCVGTAQIDQHDVTIGGGVWVGATDTMGGGQDMVVDEWKKLTLRFVHQFPEHCTSQATWGLLLRRHFLDNPRAPSAVLKRRQIGRILLRAMMGGAPTGVGWRALAGLLYQSLQYEAALEASEEGIKWLEAKAESGHEYLGHVDLFLRVIHARCLLKLGRLDEAEAGFKSLSKWVTEGEAAFGHSSGSRPMSIHQQAHRGLAQVSIARGDRPAAKQVYERLMGAALMGRGAAEHWAHAEYGWLMYEDGDPRSALMHLSKAVEIAQSPQCGATDSELCRHEYMLARVMWDLGGKYRDDKANAYSHFFAAAQHEGPYQAHAFAWLGRWYREVAKDDSAAKRCFQKALALDPDIEVAGDGICDIVSEAPGGSNTLVGFLEGMMERVPHVSWAPRRLAFLQLQRKDVEGAVIAFQAALRLRPELAELWEGLGAAYHALGRFTAALKACQRAADLEPSRRAHAAMQLAGIQASMLGQHRQSVANYRLALTAAPGHPAALLGCCEALCAAARQAAARGAVGSAADDLAEAVEMAAEAAGAHSGLAAPWKALGDALLAHHGVTPSPALDNRLAPHLGGGDGGDNGRQEEEVVLVGGGGGVGLRAAELLRGWRRRVAAMAAARDAYQRALDADPGSSSRHADVAAALYHEAHLLRAHPSLAAARPAADSTPLLLAAAEAHLLRGLALDPGSAPLWAALGAVASNPSKREYALCRSLRLDRRNAGAWLCLGRVYLSVGASGPAERCFEQARCFQPDAGSAWEAMGSAQLAALADAEGATSDYSQAIQLGAGGEALLGFAAGALAELPRNRRALAARGGPTAAVLSTRGTWPGPDGGPSGAVLGAAAKAVALLPLHPAAHHALGQAQAAKGMPRAAAASFETCLELLDSWGEEASGPVSVPSSGPASGQEQQDVKAGNGGVGGGEGQPPGALPPLYLPPGGPSPAALRAAALAGLGAARVMCGDAGGAVAAYLQLDGASGEDLGGGLGQGRVTGLSGCPGPAVGLAAAQEAAGDVASAEATLRSALASQQELQSEATVSLIAALVELLCRAGRATDAWAAFDSLPPGAGGYSHASAALAERALATLARAAAAQRDAAILDAVARALRGFGAAFGHGIGDQAAAAAAAALAAAAADGPGGQSSAAAAVHACPWSATHRAALACAAATRSPARVVPAGRTVAPLLLLLAADQGLPQPAHEYSALPPLLRLSAGLCAAACLAGIGPGAARLGSEQLLPGLQRLLRTQPWQPAWWFLVAASRCALAAAAPQPPRGRFGHAAAARWCRQALSRLPASSSDGSDSADVGGSDADAMRAHLLVCLSECELHSGGEAVKRAQGLAQEALAVAQAAGLPLAPSQRQLARCHAQAGAAQAAAEGYRGALSSSADDGGGGESGDLAAVQAMAALLSAAGSHAEAAAALRSVSQALLPVGAAPGAAGGAVDTTAAAEAAQRLGYDPRRWSLLLAAGAAQQQALAGDAASGAAAASAALASAQGASAARSADAGDARCVEALRLTEGWAQLSLACQGTGSSDGGGGGEARAAAVTEARRTLQPAVAAATASAGAHLLMASAESMTDFKKRRERVAACAGKALASWQGGGGDGGPPPGWLYGWMAGVAGDPRMACHAVHAEPWQGGCWTAMRQMRAAAAAQEPWA